MRDRPAELTDAELVAALGHGWGLAVREMTYRPVGAGSYHWSVLDDAGRTRFVTVDDLGVADLGGAERGRDDTFDELARALGAALALRRDAGLEFVVAPLPARDGAAVWRLDSRYAVSVFPLVHGDAGAFGTHRPEDLVAVADLLAALHLATGRVAARTPYAELVLPGRDGLEDALGELDRPWTGGPYAEPARRLLAERATRVTALLADFDTLVARVPADPVNWVVTHGEPHPGNLIRGRDGLRLIDWETVRIAPPERDLWMIAGTGIVSDATTASGRAAAEEALARYTRVTGRPVDPAGLALYRLWWELADIASFVDDLRRPHGATADSAAGLDYLRGYLA